VSQKKFPPLNCNFVKPIFKIFALLKSILNLLQKPYDITHLTLGMLLRYLGKLKIKFSADIEENTHKLPF